VSRGAFSRYTFLMFREDELLSNDFE